MLNSPDAELTCYPYITPVWKWPNTQQRPAPHCDCREIRSKYFLVDTHNSITTSWIFCKKYVTVLLSVKFEIILIHGIFIKWGDLIATKCVLFFYMLLHNFYKKKSPLSSTRLLSLFIQLWNATLSSEFERGLLLRHWCSAEADEMMRGKTVPR